MSEMVDRLAKALEFSGVDWQELFGLGGDPFPNIARIAIAAISEPTQEMIEAGAYEIPIAEFDSSPKEIAINCWRAMSLAALKEKSE